MSNFIGIDIGTSSAKLILIDETGKTLSESGCDYAISCPKPGWTEIDPEVWMQGIETALVSLLENQDVKQIKGIGVTGQMHTVIFMDENGTSVRPALMWNDTRTSSRVKEMKEQIRTLQEVPYIANIISTGSPAMNLLWLKENEPESFAKMTKFLIGPDYVVYRLTGTMQTDYCEASTSSMFDLKKNVWAKEMQQLLGFDASIYPEVRGTNEVAGAILPYWQEKYGFGSDVKVTVGTGDNPAAAIATGCFAKEYPVISLGTSGVMMYPKKVIDFGAKGKNVAFSLDGENVQILVQGVVQSCGSSMSWWMDNILETKDYASETDVDVERLGENNLIFYPHLVGDKTIYADATIRGGFIGLGREVTRKDMSVAVMEGIAFGFKQLTEVMHMDENALSNIKVTGGGSKNPVWMQILADVLGVQVAQMESGSGAGYGIALAAAASIGNASMDDIIESSVRIKKVYAPRPYNQELYSKKYNRYLKIHDALKMIEE